MTNNRFWETKKLSEMNREEWEALCSRCAKCCIQRTREGNPVEIKSLASLCYLLDQEPCLCSNYENRHQLVPQCIKLSISQPELFKQMPETCSYRLLHEEKSLPDWHPLNTGDPTSNSEHKIIVSGKLNLGEVQPLPPMDRQDVIPVEEKNNRETNDTAKMIINTLDAFETTSLTGGFLSTASHDIRTSLNGIIGMSQLISDTQLTAEQHSCIDTILQSTTGLLKTINYLLDISKIESGQMDISETTTDLRTVCDSLHSMFQPLAQQKGITLKCQCLSGVPLSVMCDEPLIERMLSNIVKYTLNQTCRGSVTLTIECLNKSLKGAELTCRVSGTDLCIADEYRLALLEKPSKNGTGSFQELCKTTGMDLAVSRQIIHLMNGALELVNDAEHHTAFCINLTLQQANNPAPMKLAGIDRVKTINPDTRVLLAEDNKLNQKAISSILRKAGGKVHVVSNGKEVLQELDEQSYDLILMDCLMPVMDGFEATSRIRANEGPIGEIPIIALTADTMKGHKQKCLDAGMNAYLPKPVERQDLIDTINRCTKSK